MDSYFHGKNTNIILHDIFEFRVHSVLKFFLKPGWKLVKWEMNRFHGIFVKKICARIRKIRRISSINEATFFSEQTLSIAHNFWYHPFLFCLLYFLFSFFISLFDRNDIRWIAKQVNQFQGFFFGGGILWRYYY